MYGWGRRICPGRFFADSSVWFAAATILACFDLSCPMDADGKHIVPSDEMRSGLVAYVATSFAFHSSALTMHRRIPVPFSCILKPKSPKHAQLIQAAGEDAE